MLFITQYFSVCVLQFLPALSAGTHIPSEHAVWRVFTLTVPTVRCALRSSTCQHSAWCSFQRNIGLHRHRAFHTGVLYTAAGPFVASMIRCHLAMKEGFFKTSGLTQPRAGVSPLAKWTKEVHATVPMSLKSSAVHPMPANDVIMPAYYNCNRTAVSISEAACYRPERTADVSAADPTTGRP